VSTARHRRPRTRPRAVGLGAALAVVVSLGGPSPSSTSTPAGAAVPVSAPAGPGAGTLVPAGAANAPAAQVPPAPPAAPGEAELYPIGITAAQQRFVPAPEQIANARTIVDVGKSLGLPPRAWVIAIGTALQESNLRNLGYLGDRNDHDSLGLFQQRPSAGWGTPDQVTDPTYAATAFYNRLKKVRDWPSLPLTVAAQKVQISAYPYHYAKHESEAGDIVRALYNEGPFAGIG
jgi:hypothetical protein